MKNEEKPRLLEFVNVKTLTQFVRRFARCYNVNLAVVTSSGDVPVAEPSISHDRKFILTDAPNKEMVPISPEGNPIAHWVVYHEDPQSVKTAVALLEIINPVLTELLGKQLRLVKRLHNLENQKHRLKEKEQQYRHVFEKLPDTYIKVSMQGEIVMISPSVELLMGYKAGEVLGRNIRSILEAPDIWDNIVNEMEQFWVVENLELVLMGNHDNRVWASLSTNYQYDCSGKAIAIEGLLKDITELKYMMRQLELAKESAEEMSHRDYLTGLYNRRYFFEVGEKLYENAKRGEKKITVAMMDLDHFKQINDTYGHEAGDIVLKKMANILKINLRAADVLARYGGEEFCILATNIEPTETRVLFERLHRALSKEKIAVENHEILVTASFGITSTWADSLEKMIKRSDELLYRAKHDGRNCIVYDDVDDG